MASENGKSMWETFWKALSGLLTLALVAAFTWIWNAEKRISAVETIGKDVTKMTEKIDDFSKKFSDFLVDQARKEGQAEGEERARRELGGHP